MIGVNKLLVIVNVVDSEASGNDITVNGAVTFGVTDNEPANVSGGWDSEPNISTVPED